MLDAVDPFAPSAQVQARSRQDYEADLKKLLAEGAALELEEARARRAAAEQGPKLLARASPSPKKRQRDAEAMLARNDASSSKSYIMRMKVEAEKSIVSDIFVESSKFDSVIKREAKDSQLRALAPIGKSNYLAGIQNIGRETKENAARRDITRTVGFNDAPTSLLSSSKEKGKEISKVYDDSKPAMSRYVPHVSKPTSTIGKLVEEAYVPIRHSDDDLSEVEDEEADLEITNKPKQSRHKDGTIIERIPMGPIYFKPSTSDPDFEKIEPNSGIRLRSRILSHVDLQLHLSSRYHLTPSVLYSIVKPSKGGGNLDVPVVGDFIIIGVLAEKGETSFINANALKKDIKDEDSKKKKKWDHVRGVEEDKDDDVDEEPDEMFKTQTNSQKKRRFIRFSLVDLSTPTSSATGTGILTLLLFESESSDIVTEADGVKKRGNYRGGSGGAYEKWWKESEGAVVAVLNPRVLKQMPGKPLAISPDSADSIMLIGRSKDYRSCSAMTQERKPCNKLFDGRSSDACAYHSELRLRKTAANRPETYSTTASLGSTTMFNAKTFKATFNGNGNRSTSKQPFCDPDNKKGLLPRQPNKRMVDGVLTYFSAGPSGGTPSAPQSLANARKRLSANELKASAITSSAMTANGLYGRAGSKGITVAQAKQDREDRKKEKKLRKEEMEKLLERGEEFGDTSIGAAYLKKADQEKREKLLREQAKQKQLKERLKLREKEQKKRKRHSNELGDEGDSTSNDSSESEEEDQARNQRSRSTTATTTEGGPLKKKRSNPFSVEALRLIGYDPTRNTDLGRQEDELDKLAKPRSATVNGLINRPSDRPTPKLSAPPGKKIRSGVFAPVSIAAPKVEQSEEPNMDDDDDENELMVVGGPSH